MTLVVDASALVYAGIGLDRPGRRLRERLVSEICHAPHLVDAEFGNALRRRVHRGELPAAVAGVVFRHAPVLADHRHEQYGSLAQVAWGMRDNLTFYDALYVALAAALGVPLVTVDRRLAGAPALPCDVELVG
ncbi:MAG: type II toxin-antitoxin system VapC family toxin [Jiangellaceae bacterium]